MIDFFIKIRKWVCIDLYKPPSQNDRYFLDSLLLISNNQTCKCDNIILMRDIDLTADNKNLEVFMCTFDLECMIKKPTFSQFVRPSSVDLILTNKR